MVSAHSNSLIDLVQSFSLKNMRSVAMVEFSLLIYIACYTALLVNYSVSKAKVCFPT